MPKFKVNFERNSEGEIDLSKYLGDIKYKAEELAKF
jgi:hypothetical protein